MKKKKLIFKTMLIGSIFFMNSCADDKKEEMIVTPTTAISGCTDPNSLNYNSQATVNDGSCTYPISITQGDVNSSNNALALFETGVTFPASIGHNGTMPDQGNTTTFRSTYTNLIGLTSPITPGTIFTKKAYHNNGGIVDTLQAFFGMVKREAGYWAAGGNFEYWMTPYDQNTLDTLQMPMGMLPPIVDDMMRGKIMMCAGCHADASAGGDFIFNY